MRALVISGEVALPRPFSYGLTSNIEVKTICVIDQNFLALNEKYGDSRSIALAELHTFMKQAYSLAQEAVRTDDFDVIIGIGYGAHVLANLNNSYEWRGPSVFIYSEGYTRINVVSRPLPEEVDFDTRPVRSAIIVVDGQTQKSNSSSSAKRHISDLDVCIQMNVRPGLWDDIFSKTGLLMSCVRAVYDA